MKNFIGSRALPDLCYHCPESMDALMDLLENMEGEYKIVAGCTDFIPAVRGGRWTFEEGLSLIDIKKIPELTYVKMDGERVRIGAATPISQVMNHEIIKEQAPNFDHTLSTMASPQIRNVGTIGGNICMASPAGDSIPSLLVMGADVMIEGNNEKKEVALDQFFIGPGKSVLTPNEVLTGIHFPGLKTDESHHFLKIGTRDAVVISIVSAASWLKAEKKECRSVRIALGSVAPTPIRAYKSEAWLTGKALTPENIDTCARMVSDEISPITDLRGSAEYRKDLAYTLSKRTLTACVNDLK